MALLTGVALVAVWLLGMGWAVRDAALDPTAGGPLFAVFKPGLTETEMVHRIVTAGGRPMRQTWISSVWVVDGEDGLAGALKAHDVLGTYGELPIGFQLAGCFAGADSRASAMLSLRP